MAAGPVFDPVPIRNCNSKMAALDSSCSVESAKCTCKDRMVNNDSNNDMDNNANGISDEHCLDKTKDLRLIVGRNHNIVEDLIMLGLYMAEHLLYEVLKVLAVHTSKLKPLKMRELYDDEDQITMAIPRKARSQYDLPGQNWKMTPYYPDLLPG